MRLCVVCAALESKYVLNLEDCVPPSLLMGEVSLVNMADCLSSWNVLSSYRLTPRDGIWGRCGNRETEGEIGRDKRLEWRR